MQIHDSDPDRLVRQFEEGRLTRRELITRLLALGALGSLGAGRATDPPERGSPTFAATSVDHIALSVSDVRRSYDWYMQHLGLTHRSLGERQAFLNAGDGGDFLALFKGERPGLHHFSFAIPDYDQRENARKLRAAGLTPKLRGGRTYFDDPDGIEVQVSGAS